MVRKSLKIWISKAEFVIKIGRISSNILMFEGQCQMPYPVYIPVARIARKFAAYGDVTL